MLAEKEAKFIVLNHLPTKERNTKMHDEICWDCANRAKVYLMRRDGLVSMVFEI